MSQQFPITAGDPSTRFTLPTGFVSVKVDNPTAQWLHLLDTFSYVPPGAIGAIFTLDGLPNPGAEWVAPPGVTQPGATSGQQAALTYYEVALPPTAGTVIQVTASGTVNVGNTPSIAGINSSVTTQSPQQPIYSTTVPITGTADGTVTLPTGTQAVALVIVPGGAPTHIKLYGANTGIVGLELYYFAQSVYAIPWVTGIDQFLHYHLEAGATATTYHIVALLESVPEFLQLYSPPWVTANQPPQAVNFQNITAGTYQQLVAEAANVALYLFDSVLISNNSFLVYAGTAGTPNQKLITAQAVQTSTALPMPFSGDPLTRGLGIYVFNNAGTGLNLSGHMNFSKG